MQPQKEKQHGNACSKQNAANDNKGNEQGTAMVFYHINLTNNYQGYFEYSIQVKKMQDGQRNCVFRATNCLLFTGIFLYNVSVTGL